MILCERGIRTFETYTRNTLDLTAVPLLHHLTHLPVIVDPSHATGKRWLVRPMALAAVAAGADGIMVEVHPHPDEAMSDGEQSLTFDQFADMASALRHDPRGGPDPHQGSLRHRRADHGRRRQQALTAMSAPPLPVEQPRSVLPAARLRGEPRLPGDKSISHRALMLAALAEGESLVSGAGDGQDVRATAAIVAALGASVERVREDGLNVDYRVVSPGADGLHEPDGVLDCRNSGTSLRLCSGLLAEPAVLLRPGRRRFVAEPSGGPYHRAAALDGRGAVRAPFRYPPSAGRHR